MSTERAGFSTSLRGQLSFKPLYEMVRDRLGEVVEAGGLFGREIAGCDEAINAVGDGFASAS